MGYNNKMADELERKITGAMNQIKKGTNTPANSKIGTLLLRLKTTDEALHEKLLKEYKVVFTEWQKKQEILLNQKVDDAIKVKNNSFNEED